MRLTHLAAIVLLSSMGGQRPVLSVLAEGGKRGKGSPKKLASVFAFPNDHVYIGFSIPSNYSVKIPVTESMAVAEGWTKDDEGKWTIASIGLTQVYASYGEGDKKSSKKSKKHKNKSKNLDMSYLSGVAVTGPKSDIFADGLYYTSTDGNNDDFGVLEVSFNGEVSVNGLQVPEHVTDAEGDGWNVGGCSGSMGGSHYYKFEGDDGDWSQVLPINPIYDNFGDEKLHSIVLIFGNLGTAFDYTPGFPTPTNGIGFDAGGFAFNSTFGCTFQFGCGAAREECLAYMKSVPNLGGSNMHIMLYDPRNTDQWATCQKDQNLCDQGCTCCGTPSVPVENTCTFPFWGVPPQSV